ncbi:unnamed protein product [Toxocara canis]|uniref:Methyltransf_21 domain-containing protein n=1 Tax=Toxocara canis TaxID=6265 RepID=A0A183UD38_TOXCA|nr:unnamed protein product [Toxocara canis]
MEYFIAIREDVQLKIVLGNGTIFRKRDCVHDDEEAIRFVRCATFIWGACSSVTTCFLFFGIEKHGWPNSSPLSGTNDINYAFHFVEVLDKYVGSRFIHFTTMDIEGFEYRILDQMEEGRYIHNQSVTFCQLDVELHDNVMQKLNSLKNFNQYFRSFLMHSSYVPIVSTRFLTHQKVTLINSQNQECEALFNFEQLLKPFAEKTYLIVKAIERNSTPAQPV